MEESEIGSIEENMLLQQELKEIFESSTSHEDQEEHPLHRTVTHLPSWNDLEDKKRCLFMDTQHSGYGVVFDGEEWELRENIRLLPLQKDTFSTAIINADSYYKSRLDIMRSLEFSAERIDPGLPVYVLEKKEGEDTEDEKRRRIPKERGFENVTLYENDEYIVWEMFRKKEGQQSFQLEDPEPPQRQILSYQEPSPNSVPDTSTKISELELMGGTPIPLELLERKIMRQRPPGNIVTVDLSNSKRGTLLHEDQFSKIIGSIDPDFPGKNKVSVVYMEGEKVSEEELTKAIHRYASILTRRKPARKDGKRREEEQCGVLIGKIAKDNEVDEETLLTILSQAGLASVNILKGRKESDPYLFEARRRKEAEREGKSAFDIIQSDPRYEYYLEEGNNAIMVDNPGVKKVHSTRMLERSIKDYRKFRWDLLNGFYRDIEFNCGTVWSVQGRGKPEISRHCGTPGCEHENTTPKIGESFYAVIGEEPAYRARKEQSPRPTSEVKKQPRAGSIEDPQFRNAVLNPGLSFPTNYPCFNCRSDGREVNLYYKQYTDYSKKEPNGRYKNLVGLMCPTHGNRVSYHTPSVDLVRQYEQHRNNK